MSLNKAKKEHAAAFASPTHFSFIYVYIINLKINFVKKEFTKKNRE